MDQDMTLQKSIVPGNDKTLGTPTHKWDNVYTNNIQIGPTVSFGISGENTLVINGNLIPSEPNTFSIGSTEKYWKDIHISDGTINFSNPTSGAVTSISAKRDGFVSSSGGFLASSISIVDPTTISSNSSNGWTLKMNSELDLVAVDNTTGRSYSLSNRGDENGLQGEKGEKGETGLQGVRGETGVKGEKGETGLQGVRGETGVKGEKGETGLQGVRGETGEKGETGDKGTSLQKCAFMSIVKSVTFITTPVAIMSKSITVEKGHNIVVISTIAGSELSTKSTMFTNIEISGESITPNTSDIISGLNVNNNGFLQLTAMHSFTVPSTSVYVITTYGWLSGSGKMNNRQLLVLGNVTQE